MPLIVAHRGASAHAPDNSMEAFARAVELGAPWAELDVRRAGDGALVCVHDPEVGGRAVATQASGELAARGVPRLDEVLAFARGRLRLDLELKETGCERDVLAAAVPALGRDGFVVTSFVDEVVLGVKELDPAVRAGLLLGVRARPPALLVRASELFPEARLRACRADLVAPHHRLLRVGFLPRMRRLGLPVWVWTVNDPADMRALADAGVAAIVTDLPDVALRELARSRR